MVITFYRNGAGMPDSGIVEKVTRVCRSDGQLKIRILCSERFDNDAVSVYSLGRGVLEEPLPNTVVRSWANGEVVVHMHFVSMIGRVGSMCIVR